MNCLICKAINSCNFIKKFKPYLDYESDIYDCRSCGCRFTYNDDSAHEKLHSNNTTYSSHSLIQEPIKKQFDLKNIDNIKLMLSKKKANKFIINTINKILDSSKSKLNILEIGCSQGYLTSYFIMKGCRVKGIDISKTAVSKANSSFGDFFYLINDNVIKNNAPYDVIYHVGTIGCVSDPLGLTKSWLNMLKPGGKIVFNAPNKNIIDNSNRIWVSTPPPDLVSIFPVGFWKEQFLESCHVKVELNKASLLASGYMHLHSNYEGNAKINLISDNHKDKLSIFTRIYFRALALYFSITKTRLDEEYGVNVILTKR